MNNDDIKRLEAISCAESVQERISWVLMALKSPNPDKANIQRYMRKLRDAQSELDKAIKEYMKDET